MRRTIGILAVMAATGAAYGFNWSWDWPMPGERYAQLDFNARAGVDRATKATRQAEDARRQGRPQPDLIPLYRGAAAEWKKIQIQGEAEDFDEPLLAYAVFMQGFCKMNAGDRNEAVKMFNELNDIYDDQDWITVPGRYYIGKCKVDMGDLRAGSADLDELLADEKAAGHPVLAFALLDRARRLWTDGKFEPSLKLYRRILIDEFNEGAREPFNNARDELFDRLCADLRFAEIPSAIHACVPADAEEERNRLLRDYVNRFRDWMPHGHGGPNAALAARWPDDKDRGPRLGRMRRGFLDWTKPFAAQLDKGVAKADQGYVLQNLEISVLCGEKKYDQARSVVNRIQQPLRQASRRYEVECAAGEWGAALLALDEYVSRKPDENGVRWAKYEKASVYRHRTHEIDKAIAIYLDISDPPRSTWELVGCYRESKEMKKCRALLNELASTYPGQAPRAVWTDAQYYEQDGDTKRAIALYRRLLSQPEWKKSAESSWAHQALERFGISTGGAMTNEVR